MSILKTALLTVMLALPAAAPAISAPKAEPAGKAAPEAAKSQPHDLYDALAAARSPLEARAIETRIYEQWAHTESPSEALIFDQATELMAAGDFLPAREKLNVLTEVAPDFVEGWSFRALVNRELGNYTLAVADLKHVLDIEPRHFRALGLLGSIFEELDNPKSALKAYEAAVKINPQLEGGAKKVRRLTEEVKGRGI